MLLLVVLAVVTSSCAIHDKFPFICFQGGCVHQQWSMQGLKKRMNARLAKQKRLRQARKNMDTRYAKRTGNTKENLPEKEPLAYGRIPFYTKVKFDRDVLGF